MQQGFSLKREGKSLYMYKNESAASHRHGYLVVSSIVRFGLNFVFLDIIYCRFWHIYVKMSNFACDLH